MGAVAARGRWARGFRGASVELGVGRNLPVSLLVVLVERRSGRQTLNEHYPGSFHVFWLEFANGVGGPQCLLIIWQRDIESDRNRLAAFPSE